MNTSTPRIFCLLAGLAGMGFSGPQTSPTTFPALDEQVRELRQRGEPVAPADLKIWKTLPDDRNAAKVIFGLTPRMRRATPEGGLWSAGLSKRSMDDYAPPWSHEERDEMSKALAPQREVLEQLDAIRSLDGFDWGDPPSPLAVRREDFPFGSFLGTGYKQIYCDGLLAVYDGDLARAWRRLEALQRIADGMTIYPGDHNLGPQWPSMHERAAMLAAAAAGATPDDVASARREQLAALARQWQDDRPMRDALVRYYSVQRVAVIDALRHIDAGTLAPQQVNGYGYVVSNLLEMRIGTPMWPTVVAFQTGLIDCLNDLTALSFRDAQRPIGDFLRSFRGANVVAMHVSTALSLDAEDRLDALFELRARQKLAATAIAIRLYRLDHEGRFPKTLDELVPDYLVSVPDDPVATQPAKIRYRIDDKLGPIIWTVGINGRDDGGRPRPKSVLRRDRRGEYDEVVFLTPQPAPTTAPNAR